jgi:hypothetical protein
MEEEKVSDFEKKRRYMIDIVEKCPIYKKYEKAPYTYTGTNVEDATRITVQLSGRTLKIWRVNYRIRSEYIKDIDPILFAEYIYNIVGLKYKPNYNL